MVTIIGWIPLVALPASSSSSLSARCAPPLVGECAGEGVCMCDVWRGAGMVGVEGCGREVRRDVCVCPAAIPSHLKSHTPN